MPTMKIKLAVDKSRKRVLFADAGSDFVDVLLSFLTLPLSALEFCAAGASLPGCISNLCDSVNRLRDSKLLKADACHGMLLTPTHTDEFEHCKPTCNYYDVFVKNQPNLQRHGRDCRCWLVMARLVHVYNRNTLGSTETFVRDKERFVISDNWMIKPASTSTMMSLTDGSDGIAQGFKEVEVCIGWAEVVSMLKAPLSSDTILTDAFLFSKTDDKVQAARATVKQRINQNILNRTNKDSGSSPEKSNIKIFFDRHEKKVMYAECKHEFVDRLLGFLTCPMATVIENMGVGTCHLGSSFDNLYSSAVDLDAAGFLTGPKETLLDPSLAPFDMRHNIFRQDVPGCQCTKVVEDRKYVVDDDLLIHQASAMSLMKHWCRRRGKAKVVEMDITVEKQEADALLRAVFTSKTALTDVFKSRLLEPPQLSWCTPSPPPSPPSKRAVSASLRLMQIFVKIAGKTITLEVASTYTIATVKSRIRDKMGAPAGCRYELKYAGKRLQDSFTIADYNIVKECTIFSEEWGFR